MPKNIKNIVLYKNQQFFSSFPSIACLENNQLLLLFRRARDSRWLLDDSDEESLLIKQQVDHVDSRSQLTRILYDLDLNPLSEPEPLSINPEAADQDASLLVLSNKTILLSSFSWYPVHSRAAKALRKKGIGLYGHPDITGCFYILWGAFTRISDDFGNTWSRHNYLTSLPESHSCVPNHRDIPNCAIRGQAIEIGNEILLPVYVRQKDDSTDTSHVYCSIDSGKTWIYRSMIAKDKQGKLDFNEPSLLSLGGDQIMAFMRNTTGNDSLITALSTDRGHNWGDWKERSITGHPTHPLKLSDGRIFLSYGYRHKPFGIRGHLMDSAGEHLIGEEIIIRDDGFCGDVGYPWAVELPDKRILVVYYFTQEDGIRHIAGSVLTL